MKTLSFYFDPISPFAWLAFARLPQALQGVSYRVLYKPVLFAALLKHHGQLGPAEVAPKRDWTYRQVQWLGQHLGVGLELPAAHPFNPLPFLRLALACATPQAPGSCNRWVAEQVLVHVWQGGAHPLDPGRLQALQQRLAEHMAQRGQCFLDPGGEAVKQQLRHNTDEALAAGAFGVPSVVVDDKLFWGLDGLPMLAAYLQGDAWFDGPQWDAVNGVPVAVVRTR